MTPVLAKRQSTAHVCGGSDRCRTRRRKTARRFRAPPRATRLPRAVATDAGEGLNVKNGPLQTFELPQVDLSRSPKASKLGFCFGFRRQAFGARGCGAWLWEIHAFKQVAISYLEYFSRG